MPDIRTVGIITKPNSPAARTIVPELLRWLEAKGIDARFDEETAVYANRAGALNRAEVPDDSDLIIVLGGDGTLLSAARAMSGRDIPLFAVNLGGLGFLTAIPIEDLYHELERAFRGEQRIARRKLLACELMRGETRVAAYEALNDMVITKSALARMIDVETHVDTHYVCTYKADGLIIATPTGSTAYSLSAGGPILFPAVEALCITPICPHTLTNRPVLVPDTSVIQAICLAEDNGAFLTIDGQVGEPLKHGDRVLCRSSPNAIRLIRPPKMMFFDVLRSKLKWGER